MILQVAKRSIVFLSVLLCQFSGVFAITVTMTDPKVNTLPIVSCSNILVDGDVVAYRSPGMNNPTTFVIR